MAVLSKLYLLCSKNKFLITFVRRIGLLSVSCLSLFIFACANAGAAIESAEKIVDPNGLYITWDLRPGLSLKYVVRCDVSQLVPIVDEEEYDLYDSIDLFDLLPSVDGYSTRAQCHGTNGLYFNWNPDVTGTLYSEFPYEVYVGGRMIRFESAEYRLRSLNRSVGNKNIQAVIDAFEDAESTESLHVSFEPTESYLERLRQNSLYKAVEDLRDVKISIDFDSREIEAFDREFLDLLNRERYVQRESIEREYKNVLILFCVFVVVVLVGVILYFVLIHRCLIRGITYVLRAAVSMVRNTKKTLLSVAKKAANVGGPKHLKRADELLKWKELADKGVISEQEFESHRARLLGK